MPKLLDPCHNQGCDPDNNNVEPSDKAEIDTSSPQGSNSNPMYLKTRIRHNAQETFVSILCDTGAKSNLLSASTLAAFGKNFPKLKPETIKLSSANGSSLNSLGSVTLFVRLGDKEHLLNFHIVNNLATTAILGSDDLSRLKANINCSERLISFNGDAPIRLQTATSSVSVVTNCDVSLKPGEHKFISCHSSSRNLILCSHIVTPVEAYNDNVVCSIVDVRGTSAFSVLLHNPRETVLKVQKGTPVGSLRPVTPDHELFLIDDAAIAEVSEEINNYVDDNSPVYTVKQTKTRHKGKITKPSFSRPLNDASTLTDTEIINSQLRFNGKILTESEKQYLFQIIYKYRLAFQLRGELGKSYSLIYDIRLKTNADNFYRQPYRSSDHERELMRQEIAKLIKLGIVEPSSCSYVPFCSPALLVAKSDNSARLVTDFRILNSSCAIDHFSFPRLDELLTKIGKMSPQFFGSFDLADSFFQIPLNPECKGLTTFTTEPGKLYNYLRLPQGLHNSPAALAKLTANVFGQLDFLICYADDMALLASSKDEYFANLEKFLQCVIKDNLKLSLRKSVIIDDELTFLGHVIKSGSISPTQKHLSAIHNLATPTDKPALKRVLGSLNWLKKYIKNYSRKTHVLYELLRKDVEFIWTDVHERAFQEIKEFLVSNHVLKLPTGAGNYSLFTDGSRDGLGATLLETVNGQTAVVGYASRATTPAERKVSVTELELAAIAFALQSFRHLIFNPRGFDLYTDHYAIVHIFAGKSPPATKKIASFMSLICEYNFNLFHIKGDENNFADMLSRNPDLTNIDNHEMIAVVDFNSSAPNPPLRPSPRLAALYANNSAQNPPLRRSPRIAARDAACAAATVTPPPKPIPVTPKPASLASTPAVAPSREIPSRSDTGTPRPIPPTVSQTLHNDNVMPPQLVINRPAALGLIKPSRDTHDALHVQKPKFEKPVDTLNFETFGNEHTTHLPIPRPLLSKTDEIKFANKFHGSVPARTREKVRELALKDYKLSVTRQDVRREQILCPYYRDVINYLEHQILPTNKTQAKRVISQEDNFCMIGDLLFRLPRPQDIDRDDRLRLQLVIPDSLAEIVISAKHDRFQGTGHAGFIKSILSIKRKYHIHDLANKLQDYLNKCGLCLKLRESKKPTFGVPLRPAAGKSCTGPFQKIQLDFAGPIPSNKYDTKFILVVTCEFSSFTWLFGTRTTDSQETFECLNKLIRIYGLPVLGIVSDRGPSFTGKVMAKMASVYGIDWTHDLSASPNSTGLCENRVKLCKTLLKYLTLKNESIDPYDSLLDLQFSMNNTVNSVTGLTPHFCFHGFETVDSLDFNLKADSYLPSGDVQFAEALHEQASRRKELLKLCKDLAARDMKFKYDSSIVALPDFQPGDLVLLQTHNHPLSSKKMRKFKVLKKGPYRVHNVDRYHCTLMDLDNNLLPDLFPLRKLQKIPGFKENFPADRETVHCTPDNDSYYQPRPDDLFPNSLVVGNKIRFKNNETQVLCYPFGLKDCGTYVPMGALNLWFTV